ncbi:MAG: hypothetical protein GC157_18450 [Frankiales bacterium]|nr:hypothetical protein [Frankiales bacterium]
MGLFHRRPKTPPIEIAEWIIIGEDEQWNFDIVGESKYQAAIGKAVAKHGSRDERDVGRMVLAAGEAVVQPEPDNPFDPMAVRVTIDGQTVGYVPREQAERFAEVCRYMIHEVHGKPLANAFAWRASVDARVGWLPGAPDLVYGVKLSLPDDFWDLDQS